MIVQLLTRRNRTCFGNRVFCPRYTIYFLSILSDSTDWVTGLNVIATARTKDAIKDLEEMGMSTIALDVTNSESIDAAKKEVEVLTNGRLDILVNNAYGIPLDFLTCHVLEMK